MKITNYIKIRYAKILIDQFYANILVYTNNINMGLKIL